MFKFLKNWLPVIAWAGLIFFLSSQPELKSGLPIFLDFALRKAAHMAEYMVLSFLIFRALQRHSLRFKKSLFLTAIFSFLYALLDEYHQTFVPGRQGSMFDVLIDVFGIMIAIEILDDFFKK